MPNAFIKQIRILAKANSFMALGIKTITAIVGLSIAGTGAVAGIGYGIHAAAITQQSSTEEFKPIPEGNSTGSKPNKPEEKPTTSTNNQDQTNKIDGMVADQPGPDTTVIPVKLTDIQKQLTEEKLVITKESKGKTEFVEKEKTYPYNVLNNKFEFKDTDQLLKDINVDISVSKQANTLETYAEGKLYLEVKLTRKNQQQVEDKEHTFKLEVTGFKKEDAELKKLLIEEGNKKRLLDLTKAKTDATYLIIEDLNKEKAEVDLPKKDDDAALEPSKKKATGLTELLWKTDVKEKGTSLYLGDYKIEGQVKLSEIKKEGNTVEFFLIPKKENSFLKIVEETDQENESAEVLVSEIKVVDLVPTDLEIVPVKSKDTKNTKLIEAIKANSDSKHLGYFVQETKEIDLDNLSVNLEKDPDPKPTNEVYIRPYLAKEEDLDNGKLPVEVNLVFGTGESKKVISNQDATVSELLKGVGYKFDIYIKKIEGNNETVSGEEIVKDAHSLATYFKNDGVKFVEKVDKDKPTHEEKTATGGFYRETFDKANLKEIKVNLQDSIGAKDLSELSNRLPANFLIFASFTNTKTEKSEMKLVSYPKTATLLFVSQKAKEVPAEKA